MNYEWWAIAGVAIAAGGFLIDFRSKYNSEIKERALLESRIGELERRFNERHAESEDRAKRFYDEFAKITARLNKIEQTLVKIASDIEHMNGDK